MNPTAGPVKDVWVPTSSSAHTPMRIVLCESPSGSASAPSLRVEPEAEAVFAAPSTPTEEMLAELWRKELRLTKVGRNDHFLDLGGHSLQSLSMIDKLDRKLNVSLGPRDFLRCTLAQLAAIIDDEVRAGVTAGSGSE